MAAQGSGAEILQGFKGESTRSLWMCSRRYRCGGAPRPRIATSDRDINLEQFWYVQHPGPIHVRHD